MIFFEILNKKKKISEDNELIAVANNLGEVHIYKNSIGYSELDIVQLNKP